VVAAKMSENMGQQIVVENIPGAAGLIGADRVAKAPADGYTFGAFNDSVMTMVPNMHAKMPWDTLKDFDPVSLVGVIEWGLVVANDKPYRNAADLIAAARANPGRVDYGSGGNGSPQHVAMALFASTAGITMQHVPYKGASQAAIGVAGGEVAAAFQGLGTVTSLIQAGKLRLVGVSTPTRLAQYPDVPTSRNRACRLRVQLVVRGGGARGHAQGGDRALQRRDPEGARRPRRAREAHRAGLTVLGTSPEELGTRTRAQLARYQKLMKEAGIRVSE
jgi:tripartite-type tricarboxylate transporter receptor subunit TctC